MKFRLFIGLFLLSNAILGQASGNINYQNTGKNNYQNQINFPNNNINVQLNSSDYIIIDVKGLNNVKADAYVAVFNVTQMGKTTEEVNRLMDERVNSVKEKIELSNPKSFHLDMISFVPIYEYEVEKKVFSKKSYNEIPIGFELKKNLHIEFTDPDYLNELVTICASAEIYDLIRVDYISNNLAEKKKELMAKSRAVLIEKLQFQEEILNIKLDSFNRDFADGFKIVYPVEMYKSYQAFSSSSINLKKSAHVQSANKNTTIYYQPILDKEFDFVINPTIVEPAIQVLYHLKLRIDREPEIRTRTQTKNNYFMITPNGDMKPLNLSN